MEIIILLVWWPKLKSVQNWKWIRKTKESTCLFIESFLFFSGERLKESQGQEDLISAVNAGEILGKADAQGDFDWWMLRYFLLLFVHRISWASHCWWTEIYNKAVRALQKNLCLWCNLDKNMTASTTRQIRWLFVKFQNGTSMYKFKFCPIFLKHI